MSEIGRRTVLGGLLALPLLAATGCANLAPAGRAAPWDQRPVVDLTIEVADDLASARGVETVLFTPDARVCEVVFRLWPNKPTAARDGNALTVTRARVDGVDVEPVVEAAGAPDGAPGTLVELPLPACVDAGTEIRVEVEFALVLGDESGERVGYSDRDELAWLATAMPLLAWVRGRGWARDPAVDLAGETVTSEDFRLERLRVVAPERYTVIGTGEAAGTEPGPTPGTVAHRFTAEAVRDVAVSVGNLDLLERDVDGTRLHLGTPRSGTRLDAEGWADSIEAMLGELTGLLGAFPYPDLWVTIVPALADGVEFPAALQFGDVERAGVPSLVAHELAHMWFYALVGNNQARDPWIDESFATFAQAVAAGQIDDYRLDDVRDRVRGELGRPMEYWAAEGGFGRYVAGVYDQGAAVLLEARRRVGEDRFDEALRRYVDVNAHRVVSPGDVDRAFAELPGVRELLAEYGAR